jgi:hypothetical protein
MRRFGGHKTGTPQSGHFHPHNDALNTGPTPSTRGHFYPHNDPFGLPATGTVVDYANTALWVAFASHLLHNLDLLNSRNATALSLRHKTGRRDSGSAVAIPILQTVLFAPVLLVISMHFCMIGFLKAR